MNGATRRWANSRRNRSDTTGLNERTNERETRPGEAGRAYHGQQWSDRRAEERIAEFLAEWATRRVGGRAVEGGGVRAVLTTTSGSKTESDKGRLRPTTREVRRNREERPVTPKTDTLTRPSLEAKPFMPHSFNLYTLTPTSGNQGKIESQSPSRLLGLFRPSQTTFGSFASPDSGLASPLCSPEPCRGSQKPAGGGRAQPAPWETTN